MEGCIKRISWLKSAKEVIDFQCHDDIRRYIYRLREHYIILLRIYCNWKYEKILSVIILFLNICGLDIQQIMKRFL